MHVLQHINIKVWLLFWKKHQHNNI